MCFCCCYTEDENKVHPNRKLETPTKFIQRVIMGVENYSSCMFQIIIYSYCSEKFLCLTGTGFIFLLLLTRNSLIHPDLLASVIYRIICINRKELLYTNKYEVFGKIHFADIESYLT